MPANLLDQLNPKQYEAVTAPARSVLVLAGAGSGKTRVLTTRIAWLLNQNMTRPENILAVTFTNKAAKEMMTRLESMIPYDLSNMWVGTFHGICNRILRRHAKEAGLPRSFQIMDSSDQLSLIKRVMKAANVDSDKVDAKQVQNFINWHKENGIRASRASTGSEHDAGVELYQLYEQQCQKEGAVDFAELLLRCFELLDRNEIVRRHYQDRFRHILVDEFQDTNILQYRWLQILGGLGAEGGMGRNAVFAVGDDDQSIYAFRGANVGNMSDFLTDFNCGEPIRLEENYRSTCAILEAANAVISHNTNRLGKNLWTAGGAGDPITVLRHATDEREAAWVAEEIRADAVRGNRYRDHAVLYRMNAQSRVMETALTQRGIPYRIYGGLRFFERAEVKHVLAYLRLLSGAGDDTSFLRVVNTPARGIGAKTIEKLTDDASHAGLSLWATLTHPAYVPAGKLTVFRDLMLKIHADASGLNLMDTIKLVTRMSGLEQYYEQERDGTERIENMREMISAAKGYLESEGIALNQPAFEVTDAIDQTPLQGYLTQATLEAGEKNEDADADAVQLMTVHAAKGLEFKNVYIIGAEEGIFPHFSAYKDDKGGGVDEERRLMYVAITRAKKRLAISYCYERMLYGETRSNPPSSFLEEIPDHLIKFMDLADRNYARGFPNQGHRRSDRYDSDYGWDKPSFTGRRTTGNVPWRSDEQRERNEADWRRGLEREGRCYRSDQDPVVMRVHGKVVLNTYGFQPGDHVSHKKFGKGVVKRVSGSGDDARVTIDFYNAGTKELLLALASKNLSLEA